MYTTDADACDRGGFRTGKRPCMRRVIEYIASDFRKDKFWLRRAEPSKRQYQVMVAVDDSASMVFNHSKQVSLSCRSDFLGKLCIRHKFELEVCALCGDADPRRVCRELHSKGSS